MSAITQKRYFYAHIIHKFFKLESASGILLFVAGLLALIANNTSFLSDYYQAIFDAKIGFHIAAFTLSKPVILWVNDGLMAIFFLVVSLELKREMLEGRLSHFSQAILPGIAAIGGMLVPALIYYSFNFNNTGTIVGWAIPSATDIAFSLGVLALLGKRVPISLKLFLMALAIIDDLGAIIIIALFYSGEHLHLTYLYFAADIIAFLWLLNHAKVANLTAYLLAGIFLWYFLLKSGIHATLAGVIIAIFIPLCIEDSEGYECRPLNILEEKLHPWVAFLIMPIFAFANAGVQFEGISLNILFETIPLGVALGLFLGKQIGVFSFTWLLIKTGFSTLPSGATLLEVYGVAILCGIGFTMSLFIGSLAFHGEAAYLNEVRLGVLMGSTTSAIVGFLILHFATRQKS